MAELNELVVQAVLETEELLKHMGPGPHKNGTPQSIHSHSGAYPGQAEENARKKKNIIFWNDAQKAPDWLKKVAETNGIKPAEYTILGNTDGWKPGDLVAVMRNTGKRGGDMDVYYEHYAAAKKKP